MDKNTSLKLQEKHIADLIPPLSKKEFMLSGSTDVGDVSWIVIVQSNFCLKVMTLLTVTTKSLIIRGNVNYINGLEC